jgi:hypothetical protein
MQRLKMSGVLPPLPHLLMALHIISGTLFFLQIQLLLLQCSAYICLFCVTAFIKYPRVKYQSLILRKLSLFLSLYVSACAPTSVYRYVCLNVELPHKASHITTTHVRLFLSYKA